MTRSQPYIRLPWKRAILRRQNNKCAGCGRIITLDAYRLRDWKKIIDRYPDKSVPSRARFHHVIMTAYGGVNNPSNLVGLCGRCHATRHRNYAKYKKEVLKHANSEILF